MSAKESKPNWTAVKAKLAVFDQKALLALVRDLYEASKDNQTFLHTRFGLGEDVLHSYKEILSRWLAPDPFRKQGTSVSKAKQAISDYKKAIGDPAGLAELLVFYCEESGGYCADVGAIESDINGLLHVFEQALAVSSNLPPQLRKHFRKRLEEVNRMCGNFGYGAADHMEFLLERHKD